MVMQVFRTALLAGAAAIAVAGLSGVAAARDLNTHVMTVEVPGGGVAEIRYTGDLPPQVVFSPAPTALGAFMPFGAFSGPLLHLQHSTGSQPRWIEKRRA
jgi:hypothetical protein